MIPRAPALGLRLGLFLAAIVLLPGIIALVAAGFGGAAASGLAITETTGAFSVAALQGLDRRLHDAPAGLAIGAALAPVPSFELPVRSDAPSCRHADASAADAGVDDLPLRL